MKLGTTICIETPVVREMCNMSIGVSIELLSNTGGDAATYVATSDV